MADSRTILVWAFYDAPKELRDLSRHGGDKDWLAFVPEGVERPEWIYDGSPFGSCNVSTHAVDGGTVYIGAHS